ncbi:MAG: hypothetical protein V1740_03020 [Candidatus Woesearchaeota archaeon]
MGEVLAVTRFEKDLVQEELELLYSTDDPFDEEVLTLAHLIQDKSWERQQQLSHKEHWIDEESLGQLKRRNWRAYERRQRLEQDKAERRAGVQRKAKPKSEDSHPFNDRQVSSKRNARVKARMLRGGHQLFMDDLVCVEDAVYYMDDVPATIDFKCETAMQELYLNPNKWFVAIVPWRTKKDQKPHASKKYQRTSNPDRKSRQGWKIYATSPNRKKPYRARSRGQSGSPSLKPDYKNHPRRIRRIVDVDSVFKACDYIGQRRAKAQFFSHRNPEINEAVQLMLRYVQSRVDKSRHYDPNEIVNMKNETVNGRLERWEDEHGKRIINVHDLLRGRFRQYQRQSKYTFAFIPLGTRIRVSGNYDPASGRYVTCPQEFLKAVRGTLKGEITSITHFNILDPVTAMTLEWCIEQAKFDGHPKPKDVKRYNHKSLLYDLAENRLLDDAGKPLRYAFIFSRKK